MSEVRVGDQVYVGPIKVYEREWLVIPWREGESVVAEYKMRWSAFIPADHMTSVNGLSQDAMIPFHPSLARFAEWVTWAEEDQVHWRSDLQDCLSSLEKLPGHDQRGVSPLSRETLRSFIKAIGEQPS